MALDNVKLATAIVEKMGGRQNIHSLTHCATRLRFILKDGSLCDIDGAKGINGVITVVVSGGQHQVVIGNTVADVYKEIVALIGEGASGANGDAADGASVQTVDPNNVRQIWKQNFSWYVKCGLTFRALLNKLIATIAGVFPPVLGVMAGGGLIKGITAIIVSIMLATGKTYDETQAIGTIIIFNAIGDAVFYFLPIVLGFAAGKKFGGSPYLCAVLGAALCYPTLLAVADNIWGGGKPEMNFLGFTILMPRYINSIIPILVASYFACIFEKWLNKRIPAVIKGFITPAIVLLVITSLTLLIVGPVTIWIGDGLSAAYKHLTSPMIGDFRLGEALAGVVIGAVWQVLVIFGVHWTLVPIIYQNLGATGTDTLGIYSGAGSMGQTGAALGLYLRQKKNKETKANTLSHFISGIFGITEPIIYGDTLPRKKPFVLGCVAGAIAGLCTALMGVEIYAAGPIGIIGWTVSIPTGADGHTSWMPFIGSVLGTLIAIGLGCLLVYFTYKDDTTAPKAVLLGDDGDSGNTGTISNDANNFVSNNIDNSNNFVSKENASSFDKNDSKEYNIGINSDVADTTNQGENMSIKLYSPLNGKIKPLSECSDPAFDMMGKGVVIVPTFGKLHAPCDATVTVVFETGHMIGLKAKNGAEIILHMGIDTVELNGKHFKTLVKVGDKVQRSQALAEFDINEIKTAGYSIETPVLITNHDSFKKIDIVASGDVTVGDEIIKIK